MNKIFTLIALSLIALLLCLGQTWSWDKESPPEEEVPKGLKTKTKTGYSYIDKGFGKYHRCSGDKQVYRYDKKGNMVEANYYSHTAGGKLAYKHIYKYDNTGNRLKEIYYNTPKDFILKLDHEWIYKYDKKGNRIEEARYGYDVVKGSAKTLTEKWIYTYDEKGNPTEKAKYTNYKDMDDLVLTERYIHKYDEKGNWIEEVKNKIKLVNWDGKSYWHPPEHFVYKYDEKGNRIGVYWYNPIGRSRLSCNSIYKYKYDKTGNMTEKTWWSHDELVCYEKRLYKYDTKGNRIERILYKQIGGYTGSPKFSKKILRYKYDNNDNIIEYSTYKTKFDQELGKEVEVPLSQQIIEYEFYPKSKEDK